MQWIAAAQAHAYVTGRDFVTPDDLAATARACLAHRLMIRDLHWENTQRESLVQAALAKVPQPK